MGLGKQPYHYKHPQKQPTFTVPKVISNRREMKMLQVVNVFYTLVDRGDFTVAVCGVPQHLLGASCQPPTGTGALSPGEATRSAESLITSYLCGWIGANHRSPLTTYNT